MNIVLLGAPGSGKDTIAADFIAQYHYKSLTPGEIFRQEAARGTELGIYARDTYWGNGTLCPDDIVNQLVKEAYGNLAEEERQNLIFNGYPRSVGQAEYLTELAQIDIVLELAVSEDMAVQRLLRRGREDDKEEIIRHRFGQFALKTEPVMDYYKNLKGCVYIKVDADKTPKEVFEEAFHAILENAPI